jgi:hypothetical protein
MLARHSVLISPSFPARRPGSLLLGLQLQPRINNSYDSGFAYVTITTPSLLLCPFLCAGYVHGYGSGYGYVSPVPSRLVPLAPIYSAPTASQYKTESMTITT